MKTLDECYRLMEPYGVRPPAPWLSEPVKPTAGIAKIEAESAERKRKMREDADARIEKDREHKRALVAQTKRFKELLREEALERRRQRDRVELVHRRDYREFLRAIGRPLSPLDERHLQDEQEELASDPNDPVVRILSTWLD